MLWGFLRNGEYARAFKHFPLCSASLQNLLVGITGTLSNDRKTLSKLKHVLWEYAAEISQKMVNARAFKPLPLCSSFLINLTSRDYWNSRNERKPLSQLEHDLRKCSAISQKWWMLKLSNLCHCVHHPQNLIVEISRALRIKENHFLSKRVFW